MKVSKSSSGQAEDADLTALSSCQTGGAAALALLTETEIKILDGAALSTAELNYVDGVTSAIQTQIDSKGPTAGSGSIVTTGALNAGSITSGFTSIDVGSGAISGGTFTASGNVQLNSTTADEATSGITATFTAGEALERGEVVYFKAADSKMWKALGTASATARCVAMAAEDIAADAAGVFLMQGFLEDNGTFPAYAIGGTLYLPVAETSGQNVATTTAPSADGQFLVVLGFAVTNSRVWFNPSQTVIEIA